MNQNMDLTVDEQIWPWLIVFEKLVLFLLGRKKKWKNMDSALSLSGVRMTKTDH